MNTKLSETISAPDFELTDTQGQLIRLSDYRGKPVLLVLLRGFM